MVARRRRNKVYTALIVVLICTLLGAGAQIMLKKGLNEVGKFSLAEMAGPKIFSIVFQPLVFSGLMMYGMSFVLWLYALSNFNVSFVFPLISLSYVFGAVFSMTFLKETIPPMRWLAICVIVAGCFMIIKS